MFTNRWSAEDEEKIKVLLKRNKVITRSDMKELMNKIPGRTAGAFYEKLRDFSITMGIAFKTRGIDALIERDKKDNRKHNPPVKLTPSAIQGGILRAMADSAAAFMQKQLVDELDETYAKYKQENDELRKENVELKEMLRKTKDIREAVERFQAEFIRER